MQELLEKEICGFADTFVSRHNAATRWRKPIVRFASAADPLFPELKQAVRPSHSIPQDILPGARTVVAYFLPFAREIVTGNAKERLASPGWALGYVETNRMIVELNDRLADVLKENGFRAAKLPPTHNFDEEQLMSDWSHKHIGYIAGLGRFGAHHLLITDEGCGGRIGSLITDADIPASPRPEREACLLKAGYACGKCMTRCPSGALTENGLDRHKCYDLLLENMEVYKELGVADVCGICSGPVPCSFLNPVKAFVPQK